MTLPPLPAPNVEVLSGHREPFVSYDAEQMKAYGQACREVALTAERDALKDAARLALDALEESFDTVSNAYMEAIDIWGDFPPRQHRINALKEQSDKHSASIAALKAVL